MVGDDRAGGSGLADVLVDSGAGEPAPAAGERARAGAAGVPGSVVAGRTVPVHGKLRGGSADGSLRAVFHDGGAAAAGTVGEPGAKSWLAPRGKTLGAGE